MDESRLRTVGEVVGVLAVVSSLVFVGLEIRQNAEATRAAAVAGVTGAWYDWFTSVGADREVWETVDRVAAFEDYSAADPADLAVARNVASSMFAIWANAQYHYDEGLLDSGFWEAVRTGLEQNLTGTSDWNSFVRWRWSQVHEAHPAAFGVLVDSILSYHELP